jgi:Homeobox KN domain
MLQSGGLLPIAIPTLSNPSSAPQLRFINTTTTNTNTNINSTTNSIRTSTGPGAIPVNLKGAGPGMNTMSDVLLDDDDHDDVDSMGDDDDDKGDGSKRNKSRRELPGGAVATLKAWLLSPEHFTHPYPTPQDQAMLMAKTGIDKKQLKNWFTNARRRIWKPMLKKQIEAGKLTAAAAGVVSTTGGMQVMTVPVSVGTTVLSGPGPGTTGTTFSTLPTATTSGGTATIMHGAPTLTATAAIDNPHSVQAMRVHYQQAIQDQQQQQQQQHTQLSTDIHQHTSQQQQQTVSICFDKII